MMEGGFLPPSLLAAKMYNSDVSVKGLCEQCVADSQPDIDAVFANNYSIRIPDTGFAEQF